MSKNNSLSLRRYITGFVLSISLTLSAYLLVVNQVTSDKTLMLLVAGLAVSQFIVQLIFFLHLGRESKPRFNLILFLFALLVVFIVVFGSLWIMMNLDYRHSQNEQTPADLDKSIIEDEGISR